MATNIRLRMDHCVAELQKNPNFDFNRKHFRDEARRTRAVDTKEEKQESFREILNRISSKNL